MTRKERAALVCDALNQEYGTDLRCYLEYDHDKPWQLLFATKTTELLQFTTHVANTLTTSTSMMQCS